VANLVVPGTATVTGGITATSYATTGGGAAYVVTSRSGGNAVFEVYSGAGNLQVYNSGLATDVLTVDAANNNILFAGAISGHGTVPAGGASGQVLGKLSGTDYD